MMNWARIALTATLSIALTGCFRRQVRVVVLTIPSSPVDLIAVDEPDLPELEATATPELEAPLASGVENEIPRWRKRIPLRAAPPVAPTPPQALATAVPAPVPEPDPAAIIGELSAGGDTTESRQHAAETIDATERRLATLSSGVRRNKRTQIVQVRDFQEKARLAVRSGDAQGAMTLATKAALLLDDLLK